MVFTIPAVAGPIYELARTVEFDVVIGDAATPIRVEIFQADDDESRFRARVWQREELPGGTAGADSESPEVLAERVIDLGETYLDFEAEDLEAALAAVLADLADRLAPWRRGEGSA